MLFLYFVNEPNNKTTFLSYSLSSGEHLAEKRFFRHIWHFFRKVFKPRRRYLGWTTHGNRQYRYFPHHVTWAQAQRFCESQNANLASVRNLGEYQAIQRVIYRATFNYVPAWIGGSDKGYWFWSDGTPFRYANWCRGEPNNVWGMEHCLHMNWTGNRCMNDIPCHNQYPFVCVRKRR
uniref:C-type lectin domain-containing protein n=1 Tax=Amphilophus citrinellus TaxID=61819 RepID=A0A3Q0SDB1_AMPCI